MARVASLLLLWVAQAAGIGRRPPDIILPLADLPSTSQTGRRPWPQPPPEQPVSSTPRSAMMLPALRTTLVPTSEPTSGPTRKPTSGPTRKPTSTPTSKPTSKPTSGPTRKPTSTPTSKPTSRPTSGPTTGVDDLGFEEPFDEPGCDENWETTAAEYEGNFSQWVEPECYRFNITRSCFCTEQYRGPNRVRVENGTVVSPKAESFGLVSMSEIFRLVYKNCVQNCPSQGAAECIVSYDPDLHYVKSLMLDQIAWAVDDEIYWEITAYKEC